MTTADRNSHSAADGCSTNSDGVQLCAGPYKPWSELSKSELSKDSAAAASPKSTGSLAPCSEPVPWCKTTLESDFQYTRTQGCLGGGYALYVKDDNGDVIGVGKVKIVQEIKLEPNSEQFTTWTEGDQHTAGRTDTYSWNKVAGGLQRRPGRPGRSPHRLTAESLEELRTKSL